MKREKPKKWCKCTCSIRKLVTLLISLVTLNLVFSVVYQTSAVRHHIWLAYLFPTTQNWDYVFSEGDVWKYSQKKIGLTGQVQYVVDKLVADNNNNEQHDAPFSVLDVSCNLGMMLKTVEAEMTAHNIDVNLYGLDISQRMVEETEKTCKTCKSALFDLSKLSDVIEQGGSVGVDFPSTFSYVIVSDVLYYLSFGNFPPLLFKLCSFCQQWGSVKRDERRLGQALAKLATKEVVFSNHQKNPFAKSIMKSMGANYDRTRKVYTIKGTG